ncbi:hypothetical protein COCSUDRAFT_47104 [Coccomyxa subellipsoidea C-169]|uniref:Uncharacterized protein n=1 Tax=Coccomyxa subellipsoidea (strain C-169) TaxID=574566 RepID=I0Z052_COCSC|nr:hypothetical protein COCSUDRAFT_47104 [Coccomyxa subellipsoidea C-169]EIE24021.1 hypothetical protein COCSUDRAFT_47104 [Coccomyxa subellipsoidea C-169]|eukprot:XP_005648565.1 hypothetical protein COCSUDRAFT_47104 [Coccomyxa subellipsoidea C-169]
MTNAYIKGSFDLRTPGEMLKVDELKCNPFAARIVELFSENGSGEINFQKFVNIFSVFSPRATQETKMVWAFAIWDFDGDDLIGPRDIKRGVHLLTNADMAILNIEDDDESPEQQTSRPRRKRRDSAILRGEKLTEEQITQAGLCCLQINPGMLHDALLGANHTECDTIFEVARDSSRAHTATDWGWVTDRGCIFEALPNGVGPLTACSQPDFRKHRSAWPLLRRTCDIIFVSPLKDLVIELLGREACIFNDQYIIKPPHAGEASAFPWHRDCDWLGECDVEIQPYISAWVALDDITEGDNEQHSGTLQSSKSRQPFEESLDATGLNGQQLADLSDQTLVNKGVASKLQRMQLLNRRDELLLMDEEAEKDNDPIPSASRNNSMDNVDDTFVLKERLASVGGLSAFQAEAGTSLGLALHAIEPVLSKALGMELPDRVALEAAWAEGNAATGPHGLIRQPAMRLFWRRCFGAAEEVPWDAFWTRFPKDLERVSAAELSEVFVSKANRELLQRALSRGNALMLTAVEVDFAFAPGSTVITNCHAILSAAALWRSLSRGGARAGKLTAGQGGSGSYAPAVTGLPHAPSGRVLAGLDASVEQVASLLTNGSDPPQAVAIVGPPGQGKATLALAASRHLVACAHWENAYWADMAGAVSASEAAFQLLAAFGIPSESPDASLLQAWLTRNQALPMGLIIRLPACPPANVTAHLTHLLQRLLKVGTQLQVIICAEEPLPLPKLNTAVYSLKALQLPASLQLLRQLHPQVHQQAWLSKIAAACGGSPLLLQLSGTALNNDMMPAKMVHTALTCPEDGCTALEMLVRGMACSLEEEVLHAFVLLALLPGSFSFGPAAKLLGLSAAPAQARGRLRALVRAGLLTATGPGGGIASEEARWEMHASVRDAACALADELGLGHAAARTGLVEYFARELGAAMELHAANAPVTAARLLDRAQPAVTEVLAWALEQPSQLSAHAYAAIVWHCMPLLAPRLDLSQRQAFCEAVQGLAEAAGYALGAGQAQWQVGCALSDQGLWAEAEQPLRQSLALLESQLHPDHPDLACVCNGVPCYLPSMPIFNAVMQLGPTHPEVATTMANTAGLLKAMSKFAEAETVYRTVLDMREAALGGSHPEVAACLNNLAVLLKSVALSLANLAALMQVQGKYGEAEEMLRRALSIREDALGPDHPMTGTGNTLVYVCIAPPPVVVSVKLFWLAEALPSKWLMAMIGHKYSLAGFLVAGNYVALAALLRAAGRRGEALTYARVALEAKQRAFPPNHPEIAAAMLALADTLRDHAR